MSSNNPWMAMRSLTRDSEVTKRKLAPGTVRRIAGFATPYKFEISIFLVLVIVDAIISVAIPLLFRVVIDEVDTNGSGSRSVVIGVALAIAGIAIFDAGLSLIQRYFSARVGEGLIYDLRTLVFGHVQRMPVAFFTRTQTGALVSRLNTDVIGAQQAITSTLSSVVSNVVGLVLVITAMLFLSWQITIGALVLLPVFLLPARWVGRKLQGISRQAMQLNADMSTTMTERFNVSGALLVKIFGRLGDEERQFAGKAGQVRDIGVTQAMYGRVFFTGLTLVASLATALVYGVGGLLVLDGDITLGTLVALAALLTRLYGPLTALSNVQVDVMTALVSFERVFEILDLPPMVDDKPDAKVLPKGSAAVEFRNVSFKYPTASEVSLASLESVAVLDQAPSQQVLYDVSFEVSPGTMTALVGPSGAGKTTITALVARLYDVSSGSVRVGGQDVGDVTLESLHDVVGVVTQDAHMFHDTIRANLLYARPDASEADIVEACRAAQIWDLVRSLPDGLDTMVGDRGYRLSGGEKQRLAIARLLLKAPDVVVLDEATAHLDSESEAAVQRALETALTGRTSLVIAHRLSTVRGADQILVVDGGRIVERGRHSELLVADGLYAELYRTQFANQDAREHRRGPAGAGGARPDRPDWPDRLSALDRSDAADEPAVDGEHHAGDVGRRGGEQEGGGPAELLRLAIASQRDAALELTTGLVATASDRVELADPVGVDATREQTVDPDATRTELVGHRLGRHGDAGPQPVRGREPVDRLLDRRRQHEDHRATVLADPRRDRPGHAQRAQEDGLEADSPVVVGDVDDRPRFRSSDRDQRAVEPVPAAARRRHQSAGRVALGQVTGDGDGVVVAPALLGDGVQRLLVTAAQDQLGALSRQRERTGPSQPSACTRDDVHPIAQSQVHGGHPAHTCPLRCKPWQ